MPTTSCKRRTPASTSRSSTAAARPARSARTCSPASATPPRHGAARDARRRIDELDARRGSCRPAEQATDDALDRSLTHQAFRSLPTRWQEVLWYSEIEQMKPAEIAPLLGMKPTAVAQLDVPRARGTARSVDPGAPAHRSRTGRTANGRSSASAPTRAAISVAATTRSSSTHLAGCARCSIVASEAKEVSGRLALVLLPLALGVAGTAGYLATRAGRRRCPWSRWRVPLPAMPAAVVQGAAAGSPVGMARRRRIDHRRAGAGAAAGGTADRRVRPRWRRGRDRLGRRSRRCRRSRGRRSRRSRSRRSRRSRGPAPPEPERPVDGRWPRRPAERRPRRIGRGIRAGGGEPRRGRRRRRGSRGPHPRRHRSLRRRAQVDTATITPPECPGSPTALRPHPSSSPSPGPARRHPGGDRRRHRGRSGHRERHERRSPAPAVRRPDGDGSAPERRRRRR